MRGRQVFNSNVKSCFKNKMCGGGRGTKKFEGNVIDKKLFVS